MLERLGLLTISDSSTRWCLLIFRPVSSSSRCRLRHLSNGQSSCFFAVRRWSKWTFPPGSPMWRRWLLPNERAFASGLNNLARNVFWAVGSAVASLVMRNLAFSAPLMIGGGTKVVYDVVLYRAFRKLRPPEEGGSDALRAT